MASTTIPTMMPNSMTYWSHSGRSCPPTIEIMVFRRLSSSSLNRMKSSSGSGGGCPQPQAARGSALGGATTATVAPCGMGNRELGDRRPVLSGRSLRHDEVASPHRRRPPAAAAVAAEPPRWYAAPTPSPSPSPERQEHGRSAVASAPSLAPPMPGLGGGAAARISVVAPGAGTGANAAVYAELGRMPDFRLDIKGQARAPYDRYPASWQGGAAGPNLETFAAQLMDQGIVEQSDCLVVGSRGGQVVLPSLWSRFGASVPPAVVINGGCSMGLPTAVHWPTQAVTFLLIGGQDNFRGKASVEEYIADTKSRVPKGSSRTAILYVSEMQHMPQSALLGAVLPQMVRALLAWKRAGASAPPPHDKMQAVLAAVAQQNQWSGRLMYTCGAGVWQDLPFGGANAAEKVAPQRPRQAVSAAFGGA
mmetsp:Transcript_176671/g.566528  ORF Transcript_176671/g.566528 Transcript_176671/m.566528 type:complete len:420 (+) Transcript_176671:46-1305(+)